MALFREETRIRPMRRHAISDASTPRRFVLRGRVVTMDAGATVIPDGLVCIQDDSIAAVASIGTALPSEFQQAPIVQTSGTIYPGLIELHNHPAYNAIPLWAVPQLYPSRTQWRADPVYKRCVLNPASLLTHHPQEIYPKSVARFVECRALLGGVTTTQGLTLTSLGNTASYYEGLIRNVEFSYGTDWPTATDHINDFTSFSEFDGAYGPLMNQSLSRFVIHLCEGTDAATKAIFGNLLDSTGKALIGNNLVAIHATALGAAELASLKASAGVVWSPTSNFLLYGATTDISDAISAGVAIALGCDWAPSGTKNLLGELKIAKATSEHLGNLFSDQQLVGMVTTVPAKMIGWDTFLGSIESGKQADLTVIGTGSGNPYSTLISATESDVAAVVIGGKLRAGRASIADPRTPGVELIRVAEQEMVLDLIDDPIQPLAHVSLQASIATLSYALEHLPDLAQTAISGHAQMKGALNAFQIRLEMDEHLAEDAAAGVSPIQPGDVDPMEFDPITAVDDKTFIGRLQKNPNLPDWLKAAM
jgi:cytosine/adenosine deaminase-related metal-dependent hydrolase